MLRPRPRIKPGDRNKRHYLYLVFEKEAEVAEDGYSLVVSVDVNESIVAVKVGNRVYILGTDIKKLTLAMLAAEDQYRVSRANSMWRERSNVERGRRMSRGSLRA